MATSQKTRSSASKTSNVKLLCSYGGKILPRPSDGLLRYSGGLTRVVSVHRSVSFSELMEKLRELCGNSVTLRCQLPGEDLDVLVSIKSDEDLANVIEEYDRASLTSGKDLKIRAILFSPKSSASPSQDSSASSCSSGADLSPPISYSPGMAVGVARRCPAIKPQYGAVRKFFDRYPCHLQANYQPPSYLYSHHYKKWS